MLQNKKHTAILIFANSPYEEIEQKGIVNGGILFEYLNQQTFLEANKTGLDVILFSGKFQKGNSFGERFSNAIESVFLQGYEYIITIGNDSPDLKTSHLITAKENLQKNSLTLGPSLDGGTYLITLSKQDFNKQRFANLPWQTSQLFADLKNYLTTKNNNVQELERIKDIDSTDDLHYFLSRFKTTPSFLRKLILRIISPLKKITSTHFFTYQQQPFTRLYNKGSPLRVH